MRLLNPIALLLVIVGALNWGLIGPFEFDLVAEITGDTFGETNPVSRIVYVLVGAAGVYLRHRLAGHVPAVDGSAAARAHRPSLNRPRLAAGVP